MTGCEIWIYPEKKSEKSARMLVWTSNKCKIAILSIRFCSLSSLHR